MVGMILITLDFLHNTRECIASLQRATSYPYVLTVVDNASTDSTCDFLEQNGIEVIRNPSRVHLSVALNQGLRRQLARPEVDCVCWIHNDMRFYPGWLENLVREFGSDPRIGKLAPYNILNEGRADEAFALEFMAAHRGQARQAYEVPWVMPRRVVEQVGFYDEGYLACGGYEEWDYNNRLPRPTPMLKDTSADGASWGRAYNVAHLFCLDGVFGVWRASYPPRRRTCGSRCCQGDYTGASTLPDARHHPIGRTHGWTRCSHAPEPDPRLSLRRRFPPCTPVLERQVRVRRAADPHPGARKTPPCRPRSSWPGVCHSG